MLNLVLRLFGPLAGPECRRALGRGWLILVRALAGLAVCGVVMLALWWWWINAQMNLYYLPYYEMRIGFLVIEGMLVTIALLLGPAVMAGSLAGDKERGVLALLLTTRVNAGEIVAGRLTGKLTQVAMIVLAGVPGLVCMAALAGLGPPVIGLYLLLPAAVAFGAGGLAAIASVVSRRGRDALLAVYFAELLLMLSPLLTAYLGMNSALAALIAAANPYSGLTMAIEESRGLWISIAYWTLIGAAGCAASAWRLRASCLAPMDGERSSRNRKRRRFVPPLNAAHPMLWKELFIERVGTLGRFGRWVGLLLTLGLIGGSVGLTALIIWDLYHAGDHAWASWSKRSARAVDRAFGGVGKLFDSVGDRPACRGFDLFGARARNVGCADDEPAACPCHPWRQALGQLACAPLVDPGRVRCMGSRRGQRRRPDQIRREMEL